MFQILSGENTSTRGQAYINGSNVKDSWKTVIFPMIRDRKYFSKFMWWDFELAKILLNSSIHIPKRKFQNFYPKQMVLIIFQVRSIGDVFRPGIDLQVPFLNPIKLVIFWKDQADDFIHQILIKCFISKAEYLRSLPIINERSRPIFIEKHRLLPTI